MGLTRAELFTTGGGGGASGIFGIADATGTYTYYSTLTLAMLAAVTGQTIEMFADVVETGAVTITLREGVTLNGNGHTYSLTTATLNDVFQSNGAGNYRIYNLNVNRTNGIANTYVLRALSYVASYHYLDGCHFTTDSGGIKSESANIIQKFYDCKITISGAVLAVTALQDAEYYNLDVTGTSASTGGLFGVGIAYNCTINNSGTGICAQSLDAFNCIIIARGGGDTCRSTRNFSNCSIYNFAGFGNYVNCQQFNNCLIYSATSYGSYAENLNSKFRNCTIISAANIGAVGGVHENNSITSLAGRGASNNDLTNCSVYSSWNNTLGHAFVTSQDNRVLKNNSFKVANASANCINSTTAKNVYYAACVFEGATTPVNANITQLITNTQDNQGNILI